MRSDLIPRRLGVSSWSHLNLSERLHVTYHSFLPRSKPAGGKARFQQACHCGSLDDQARRSLFRFSGQCDTIRPSSLSFVSWDPLFRLTQSPTFPFFFVCLRWRLGRGGLWGKQARRWSRTNRGEGYSPLGMLPAKMNAPGYALALFLLLSPASTWRPSRCFEDCSPATETNGIRPAF